MMFAQQMGGATARLTRRTAHTAATPLTRSAASRTPEEASLPVTGQAAAVTAAAADGRKVSVTQLFVEFYVFEQ